MNENTTATPENNTTTAPAPVTQPLQPAQPVVDVETMTANAAAKAEEAATKKMEAVFKSMLQQQGLDPETITKMTEEWKSSKPSPEQITKDLQDQLKAEQDKNAALNLKIIASGKGIPGELADKYIALAKTYADADKDMGKALDAALADFPLSKPAAINFTGAPGNPSTEPVDEFAKRIAKYQKK